MRVCPYVSSGSAWGQEAIAGGGGVGRFLSWDQPVDSEQAVPIGLISLGHQSLQYHWRNELPLSYIILVIFLKFCLKKSELTDIHVNHKIVSSCFFFLFLLEWIFTWLSKFGFTSRRYQCYYASGCIAFTCHDSCLKCGPFTIIIPKFWRTNHNVSPELELIGFTHLLRVV